MRRGIWSWVDILDKSMRFGSKERRLRDASMRVYAEKSHQGDNLRAGSVWKVRLSMSNPNEVVCGIDEARHGDLVQRLGGAMIAVEASVVAVGAADGWCLGHRDMLDASTVIGDVVDVGTSTEGAGVVVENGGFDEGRKESRPRLN